MDGYLRLVLLVVAAIIVSFILLESWFRRRAVKQMQLFFDNTAEISINPDDVLGLDAREPTLMEEGTVGRMHDISKSGIYRKNEGYANKTYPATNKMNTHDTSSKHASLLNDLLVISVLPQPDMQFGSYDLLQTIVTTGMQFGDMNIFHYKVGSETLFSLSSVNEPGDFNLDQMGNFSCDGLTLFANLREVSHPEKVFELMLAVAEQLAEDLNGELRAGTRRPWNNDAYNAYKNKVTQYQLMKSV